jgi:uncharacterized cofD-like protein
VNCLSSPRSAAEGGAISTPCNIVTIGGGTGLSVLLRGLKKHVGDEIEDLSAVVTVSDDGGSSGRLRRDFGVPPPGDIRNCIAALADDEDLLVRLFQYRFPGGDGLSGHSFGNLLLTALSAITGDFYQAVLTAESILSVRGRILPATLTDVHLRAVGASGAIFEGESAIGASSEPLSGIELEPAEAPGFAPAVEAIRRADVIVLGPGSLYTSILPNLLISDIREAVLSSAAPVVLPVNLMTQPGETDDMSAVDHLDAIERHTGRQLVDKILTNGVPISDERMLPYREAGASLVEVEREEIEARGVEVRTADLLDEGELIRHNPDRLAEEIIALAESAQEDS